eukprot:5530673-Amphidinium_carterae.1
MALISDQETLNGIHGKRLIASTHIADEEWLRTALWHSISHCSCCRWSQNGPYHTHHWFTGWHTQVLGRGPAGRWPAAFRFQS